MRFALRCEDVPGAASSLSRTAKTLTARGVGYADAEKHTPVDPERTLFRPGLIAKLFTWTAVMQQVERGKIDLDADFSEYLGFKSRRVPASR